MNVLEGAIESFETCDGMSNLKIKTKLGYFYCIVLETPQTVGYVKEGVELKLLLKDSDFIILKEPMYPFNTIKGVLKHIEESNILVNLNIQTEDLNLSCLTTKKEFEHLNLKLNDIVFLYIKSTNILLEV